MSQSHVANLFRSLGLPEDAIDAHVHPYELLDSPGFDGVGAVRPDLAQDYPAAVIESTVLESGFSQAIMVQVNDPHQGSFEEAQRFDTIASTSSVLTRCVVGADLTKGRALSAELDRLVLLRSVCGVRVIGPQDSGAGYYGSREVRDALSCLGTYRFACDLLIRERNHGQMTEIVRLLGDLGSTGGTFIGDHLLKPSGIEKGRPTGSWRSTLKRLANHPRFYLKISGLPGEVPQGTASEKFYPFLDEALEALGGDRLIFGSDYPVSYAHTQSVALILNWMQVRGLRGYATRIFRTNAMAAYGLNV
ncbi:MAG: amidohydrolase family protein [Bdellovibrionota bacterium]